MWQLVQLIAKSLLQVFCLHAFDCLNASTLIWLVERRKMTPISIQPFGFKAMYPPFSHFIGSFVFQSWHRAHRLKLTPRPLSRSCWRGHAPSKKVRGDVHWMVRSLSRISAANQTSLIPHDSGGFENTWALSGALIVALFQSKKKSLFDLAATLAFECLSCASLTVPWIILVFLLRPKSLFFFLLLILFLPIFHSLNLWLDSFLFLYPVEWRTQKSSATNWLTKPLSPVSCSTTWLVWPSGLQFLILLRKGTHWIVASPEDVEYLWHVHLWQRHQCHESFTLGFSQKCFYEEQMTSDFLSGGGYDGRPSAADLAHYAIPGLPRSLTACVQVCDSLSHCCQSVAISFASTSGKPRSYRIRPCCPHSSIWYFKTTCPKHYPHDPLWHRKSLENLSVEMWDALLCCSEYGNVTHVLVKSCCASHCIFQWRAHPCETVDLCSSTAELLFSHI